MVENRWRPRAGPAILALGLVALSGLLGTGRAGAGETRWSPPDCAVPVASARTAAPADPAAAAWYRIDPALDDEGALSGQRLVVGGGGLDEPRAIELPAESFAGGPFGATVLAGSDDGRRSTVRLLDLAAGCATTVAVERDVVRRATIDPSGAAIYEFRVDRVTRADRGIWRRPLDAATGPERILPPIAPDERFGPTFLTDLSWSLDGTTLVVQSCGQAACRTRLLEPGSGRVDLVDAPDLGDTIGVTDGTLVSYAACRGLPCPIVALDIATGGRTVVTPEAGFAALAATAGGPRLAYEDGPAGGLRVVDLAGRGGARVETRSGLRLVPGPMRAGASIALPPGWLPLAPDGRPLPVERVAAFAADASDLRIVPLGEVVR